MNDAASMDLVDGLGDLTKPGEALAEISRWMAV